jgi:hypothetical protein
MLDISDVTRAVDLRNVRRSTGYVRPNKAATRKTPTPLLCTTEIIDKGTPFVRISYVVVGRWGLERRIEDSVRLLTTQPNFGGVRWWFSCPHLADGKECGRRVGKLYRPPGERYFACRHCLDLAYESCQKSHCYDRLCALLSGGDPDAELTQKQLFEAAAHERRRRTPAATLLEAFDATFR